MTEYDDMVSLCLCVQSTFLLFKNEDKI